MRMAIIDSDDYRASWAQYDAHMNNRTRRAHLLMLASPLLPGAIAMSRTPTGTESINAQAVRAAFANWAAGTGSPFDLLAPDAKWTIVGNSAVAKTYENRDSFIREVIAPFNARMKSPLVPTVHEMLAAGDTVVVRFDGASVARDGVAYTNSYAWLLKLRGGKAVSVIAFFDSIAFDALWARVSPGG
jgi:ketosteroid isomerase-like protein